MSGILVLKIGGHEISDRGFLTELAVVIRNLGRPCIVVHGGGKEISAMQEKLGIEPQYLDGIRITDAASMSVVEMVLGGMINKRLVGYLYAGGVEAIGLTGIDRGIVRAERMPHPEIDMGFTGEVTGVRGDVLTQLVQMGMVPVIAPICLGKDSHFNVNADHVAGAVAHAVHAERVVFLTNVEGVLVNGAVCPTLTESEAQALIGDGTIYGGMIPKVSTALEALASGVSRAVITNLTGLKTHGGTVFIRK